MVSFDVRSGEFLPIHRCYWSHWAFGVNSLKPGWLSRRFWRRNCRCCGFMDLPMCPMCLTCCILKNIRYIFRCTSSFVFSFVSLQALIFHFHLERWDIFNSHHPVIPVRKQRSQRHVVWMISWHRASNVKLCMSLTWVHARQEVAGLDVATILVKSTGSRAY